MQVSGGAVKRVVVCYDQSDAYLVGLQMFDSDNTILLEAVGDYYDDYSHKEWILEDGERIIGFKSRKHTANYHKIRGIYTGHGC